MIRYVLIFLLIPVLAFGGDASFSWLPNPESSVTGYTIRYGLIQGGPYTDSVYLPRSTSSDWINSSNDYEPWSLVYVDSEEMSSANTPAVNAFDNNPNTIWHTEWVANNPGVSLPHEIQIDLIESYIIEAFRYLPRQDGSTNGTILLYEFYVSSNGTDWGAAVSAGAFSGGVTEKIINISATGRYVRLLALSEVNGNPWTAVAEIDILAALVDPSPKSELGLDGRMHGVVQGLVDGTTYYFVCTATDGFNTSGYSREVKFTIRPGISNIRIY